MAMTISAGGGGSSRTAPRKNPFAGVRTSATVNTRTSAPSRTTKRVNRTAPKRTTASTAGSTIGRSAASAGRKVSARTAGTTTGRSVRRTGGNVSSRTAPSQSYSAPSYSAPSSQPTSFASSSLGTTGSGTFSALAAPPEPPAPKTWDELSGAEQEDYLGGDSTYVAQRAALLQALADEEAAADRESNEFGQDIAKTLRNLGWAGAEFEADDAKDVYKFAGGGWNPEDRLGAFGQAFGNQENDFASRGMLDSSAYDRAHTDLRNSFDQQRGDVMDSFTTFLNNAMGRRNQARSTQKSDEQRARADAIARRAASLGLV